MSYLVAAATAFQAKYTDVSESARTVVKVAGVDGIDFALLEYGDHSLTAFLLPHARQRTLYSPPASTVNAYEACPVVIDAFLVANTVLLFFTTSNSI